MLTQRFDYTPMSRVEIDGKRHYSTPDGNKVASVTTILSATTPKEKLESLENWRKTVGRQNAANITLESSGRGTRMHKFLEDYILSGEISQPGTNPHSIKAASMASKIIDNGLKNVTEFNGVECSLFYPELYAGTTDLVGKWKGNLAILDFKQSNKLKKREWIDDYFMQLTSYAQAHNKMFDTDIKTGVVLMCTQDLEYQEFIIEGDEFDFYANKWWDRVQEYYSR